MRVVKQDETLQATEERENKKREARDKYYESLRENPKFQKFVVKDLFEAKIKEISNSVFSLDSDDDVALAKGLRLAQLNKASLNLLIDTLRK